jgi:hypothetical protein
MNRQQMTALYRLAGEPATAENADRQMHARWALSNTVRAGYLREQADELQREADRLMIRVDYDVREAGI